MLKPFGKWLFGHSGHIKQNKSIQVLVAYVAHFFDLFLAHMLSLAEEKVSEWYTIFTLAFQVILGFAVP